MQFLMNSQEHINEALAMKKSLKRKQREVADSDYLKEELLRKETTTMRPKAQTLGSQSQKKNICTKICTKMQFIKYNTGMRVLSKETQSSHKMVNVHGILLMLLAVFAFCVFLVRNSV